MRGKTSSFASLGQTLSLFQSTFPRVLAPDLLKYIHLSINNLNSLLPLFHTYYLSSTSDALKPPSPESDIGFIATDMKLDDLACVIFDFLIPAVRVARTAASLVTSENGDETGTDLMEGILGIVLGYVQVTKANASFSVYHHAMELMDSRQEEEWLEDANAFVLDDDDETEQYGLRVGGLDVVGVRAEETVQSELTLSVADGQMAESGRPHAARRHTSDSTAIGHG